MRNYVIILCVLLILWITGSSYWYVCRVRGDCKNSPQAEEIISRELQSDKQKADADSIIKESVEEARSFLINTGTQKVYFATSSGTTDMNVLPREYFDKLRYFMENKPSARIEISGHTDNSGTETFNRQLGSVRAEFVKSFLVSSGIDADKVRTSSKASGEPADTNDTEEGRAKNRRTDIKIII